jgi:hypothetical protein
MSRQRQKINYIYKLSGALVFEEKRRNKAISEIFDKKSCLKLVFASLIRATQRRRRLDFSFSACDRQG